MSNDGTRWVEGVVLGLAMVAVGCGQSDPGDENSDETDGTGTDGDGDTGEVPNNGIALELELARFGKSGRFLLLRFSEPMAPVDGVDPSDFRVSLALASRYHDYGQIHASTAYWDPLYYLGYDDYAGYSQLTPDLIANGKQPTDIVLRFASPMTAAACSSYQIMQADIEQLDEDPGFQAKIGLFPHYSPGAVKVESADREALAPIGADWVELPAPYMYLDDQFGWLDLDPQIDIPCDVEGEP